ncbi:MAG: ComEA family DNA-binding protein [Xanthomonadaceae bacterium]|nr:ComEA family DNA-binding protein [Xanthomonadaceae bacterium]
MKTSFTHSIVVSLLLAAGLLSTGAHAATQASARAGSQAPDKVNLNTADAATIDRVLLNVGPSKAEAIVAYRKEHGSFKSPEQLALVKGIGLKTVEKNRDRIVLGGSAVPVRPHPAPVARR